MFATLPERLDQSRATTAIYMTYTTTPLGGTKFLRVHTATSNTYSVNGILFVRYDVERNFSYGTARR